MIVSVIVVIVIVVIVIVIINCYTTNSSTMEDGEVSISDTNTNSTNNKRKIKPNATFLGALIKNVNKVNEPLYRVEKQLLGNTTTTTTTTNSNNNSNNNSTITYASFQAKGEVELLKMASFYGIEIAITGYNKNAEGYGTVSNDNNNINTNDSSNNDSSNNDDNKILKRQKILLRIAELK